MHSFNKAKVMCPVEWSYTVVKGSAFIRLTARRPGSSCSAWGPPAAQPSCDPAEPEEQTVKDQ